MYCKQCGNAMRDEDLICSNCGFSYENNSTQPEVKSVVNNEIGIANPIPVSNESSEAPKKSSNKTVLLIAGIVAGIVVIALIVGGIVILKAFSSGPKVDLKKVYDDCDLMWPWANCGSDGSYIAIDTNPYDVDDGDYTYTSTAFSAVKRVNDELGLPSYLINEMSRVNALQGRQTEKFEDAGIEVSYSYHPDHGLEVTYKLIK